MECCNICLASKQYFIDVKVIMTMEKDGDKH